jgi:5-methylcytosine-specific restriction endonuclease McrA
MTNAGELTPWQRRLLRRKRLHALGLKMEEYDTYLQSAHWQDFRKQVFAKQRERLGKNCCERCPKGGDDTKLHVHHLTYERLGKECFEDVQIICGECHDKEHGRDAANRSRYYRPGYFD